MYFVIHSWDGTWQDQFDVSCQHGFSGSEHQSSVSNWPSCLTYLYLYSSVVPMQWKSAVIRPVPKVATAKSHTDFRPISITPVLTRIMGKSVVRHFLYPAFNQPSVASSLSDQFAFRRTTGSTTSAIVFLLHTVTQMLNTSPYVIVIATDFSKAFDTVRYITLLEKLAAIGSAWPRI